MPNFELSDEEKQLSETARDFARKEIIPVAAALDEHGTFPLEICKKGWETGLMNCELPEAYGGLGLSCLAHCLVLEEISYGCTGVNTTMAANMLGTMPLIIAGTDAQKKEYFGRLLAEPIFAAYCCSEPDAGSDVAGMKTRFKKVGDDYVITGQKRWITKAAWPASIRSSPAKKAPPATRGSPASWSIATRRGSRSARKRTRWGSAAPTPPT